MSTNSREGNSWFTFAMTILLSSFLIFQVQPLISKYILPWFGGTPGVWTACMLFFQVLLFAGYAYAHLSIQYLKPNWQCLVHAALIVAALALLPISPDVGWKPQGPENPTWRILGLLLASVGLPYFILSSTGPLLQAWFSRSSSGASPYRLYALSNLGSVVGLVSYPFLIEPAFTAETQAVIWSWSFAAFALCCFGGMSVYLKRSRIEETLPAGALSESVVDVPPTLMDRWLWFALAACASVMLLAITNQVCLDVAVIPFLWVLPLTLYLISFILCFDSERWYPRSSFAGLFVLSICGLLYLFHAKQNASILTQISISFAALFVCCMVCHGELVKLRPSAKYLTAFYLSSSAGGAAGGILVGLVAPLVFTRYVELHLGMLACCLTVLVVYARDKNWILAHGRPAWGWTYVLVAMIVIYFRDSIKFPGGMRTDWVLAGLLAVLAGVLFSFRKATWMTCHGRPVWAWACIVLAMLGLARVLRTDATETVDGQLAAVRNFYGILRVAKGDVDEDVVGGADQQTVLVHGRIMHGKQFASEERRRIPTSYYGELSGVGLAIENIRPGGARRVGMVGLGVGTLAAYGKKGDYFRFYEINPAVIDLAEKYFTYLKDCPAQLDVILGDARLSMEREDSQKFDVLVLDAFSSDAIPAHLLTREAFAIYERHLKPDGVLAIHISNRHFDLRPVVTALAEDSGMQAVRIASEEVGERQQSVTNWMLVTKNQAFLELPAIKDAIVKDDEPAKKIHVWTDNYTNVVQILKR